MFGFFKQLLTIDATTGDFQVLPVSEAVLKRTLGGKGLAAHLLLEHNPPGVDPLAPENRLIFAAGPVTGTAIWGSCRHGVFTRSPQTGFFSESYSGGTAAEPMVATGFDAVMVSGASKEPVWIEVSPEGAVFHSAKDLWGLDTYETEDRVKAWIKENRPRSGRAGVLVIGPAGENLVRFAVIENDYWRSAGRTGVGAVMGSKKIKAVAFWGDRKRDVADEAAAKAFTKDLATRAKDDRGVKAYKSMGTPMMVDITSHVGSFPSRYWKKGTVDHIERINSAALEASCEVKPHACLKCFIACSRLSTVKAGRHQGLQLEGPEYETIFSFGGLCLVDSMEEIMYLNDLCDRLGMDTISAGNLIAMVMEGVQQGRIQGNYEYGNVEQIEQLLRDMAACRDMGATLAQGIQSAAAALNMADLAIHVKGLEPAGYDPRVLKGMGLGYGTSPRGACHLRSTFYKPELSGMVDPETIPGKAAIFVKWEDRLTFFDTLVLCRFYRDLYQWEQLGQMVNAVTGLGLTEEDMINIAQSVSDDVRRFNVREGLTPEHDHLPSRFYQEPAENGKSIAREDMDLMLREYYQARGWDEEGRPKG